MGEIIRNGEIYGTDISAHIKYDNSASGLLVNDVQGGIDELAVGKVDIDQGITEAGKALVIGADGMVTTGDAGVKVSTKSGNGIEEITTPGQEGIYVDMPFKFKHDSTTDEYGYIDDNGDFQAFSAGIDFIAPDFDAATEYEKGAYVINPDDSLLYERTAEKGNGPWNAGEWEGKKLADISSGGNSNLVNISEICYIAYHAENFNASLFDIVNGNTLVAWSGETSKQSNKIKVELYLTNNYCRLTALVSGTYDIIMHGTKTTINANAGQELLYHKFDGGTNSGCICIAW